MHCVAVCVGVFGCLQWGCGCEESRINLLTIQQVYCVGIAWGLEAGESEYTERAFANVMGRSYCHILLTGWDWIRWRWSDEMKARARTAKKKREDKVWEMACVGG